MNVAVSCVLPEELLVEQDRGAAVEQDIRVVDKHVVRIETKPGETVASILSRLCDFVDVAPNAFQLFCGSFLLQPESPLLLPSADCEIHLIRKQQLDPTATHHGIEVYACGVAMPRRVIWAAKEVGTERLISLRQRPGNAATPYRYVKACSFIHQLCPVTAQAGHIS